MKNKEENKFYVYAYLDPRKPGKYIYGEYEFCYKPFYIGKGSGRRSLYHIEESKKIKNTCLAINRENFKKINLYKINTILQINQETEKWPIIIKIKEKLNIQETNKLEIDLINKIGRYDIKKGPLTNLTDGGEGTYGVIRSKETIKKMSEAQTGKKASAEAKLNMSKSGIGRKVSAQTRKKLSISLTGEKNPMYGKKGKDNPNFGNPTNYLHSPELLEQIRIKNTGRKQSKEEIQKRTKSRKEKIKPGKYKITNPDGVIYYVQNNITYLKNFCEIHKLSQVSILRISKGLTVQYRGWKCEFFDGDGKTKNNTREYINNSPHTKLFKITNPKGIIFYVNNGLSPFCKTHNLCYSNMLKLAKKKINNYKKWKCEYFI